MSVWTGVRQRVEALRAHGAGERIFGASEHGFVLEPVLTTDELADLEAYLSVALPEEYRSFLTEVGADGASDVRCLSGPPRADRHLALAR